MNRTGLSNVRHAYSKNSYRCQCLVVGSGAGGSTTAQVLAAAGKNVIVVEEGRYYETETFRSNPSSLISKLYRNNGVVPFLGSPMVGFAEGRCVGGGTVINGGIYKATPSEILKNWSSQLGLEALRESEFSRHLESVEAGLGVIQEQIGPGNLDSRLLQEAASQMNLDYEVSKRFVVGCQNSNRCPTGCPTGAKQSVNANFLARATEAGVEIFSGLRVLKILSSNHRVTGVLAKDESGQIITIECDDLFLAGGPIQSPFLLRKSGLSRKAGKSILYHMPLKTIALFDRDIKARDGTSSKVVVNIPGPHPFKLATTNMRPEYIALALSSFGSQHLNNALSQIDRVGIFNSLIQSHSVGSMVSARFGQPIIFSRYKKKDTDYIRSVLEETVRVLFTGGAKRIYLPLMGSTPIESMAQCRQNLEVLDPRRLDLMTVHAMGSCAMGRDPSISEVAPDGRVWGSTNLYVTDASVLPTSIGVGPQATTMAMAHMIAERYVNGHA